MYFQSIKGLTIAASLFITTVIVRCIAIILITIILIICKKSLKLNRVKVFPLLGYN